MKKLLSLTITLIFILQLFTLAVQAAPVITIDIEMVNTVEEILKVSGTVSNDTVHENRLATIAVTPKGVTADEANLNAFSAFAYAEIGEDGKYEANIGFSHSDGEYDFHVIYEDGAALKTFKYIAPTSLAGYIRQIRDGAIGKAQLYDTALSYQNAISLDLAGFATDKEKAIYEHRVDASRNLLAGTTDAEIIEDFNEVLTLADGECDFIEGLEAISYAGSYYKYLLDNQKYTKIDFTAYNALTETQKDTVVSAFINQTFDNGDEVKTYFDSKVTAAQSGGTQAGGSPGGSGGGGGGSAISGGAASENNVNDRYNYGDLENQEKEEVNVVFNDIYSVSWAAEAITKLYEAGIVDGVAEKEYQPNGLVTREQFAKLLAVTLGIYDENATTDFSDAKDGWYTPYIASVKNAGLINGVGDNMFGVGRNITRQDMAVMLYNALKYKSVKLGTAKDDFTDFESVEDYAKEAVKFLAGAGIINGMGDGTFAPNDNATRAQAAVLIYALKGRIE